MKYFKFAILLLLAVSITASYYVFQSMKFSNASENELIATIYTERIQSFLERVIEPTKTIESLIKFNDGYLSKEEFDSLAETFYDASYMEGIGYLPEAINTYLYPEPVDKSIIGKSVLSEGFFGASDAKIAIETQQIAVSGPYLLPKGTPGIVIRTPVYINGEFWGFTSVGVNPVKMLESEIKISQLNSMGYEFCITSNYNEEQVMLYETEKFDMNQATSFEFSMGGITWELSLYNLVANTNNYLTAAAVFFIAFSAMISFYSVIQYFYKKHLQAKTEAYKDPLTKLYNRKFFEEFKSKDAEYTLFYIDLNDFKPVNDTFGHKMGDYVLIEFSKRLTESFRDNTYIARLGGDEFAVIIECTADDLIKNISERIRTAANREFIYEGNTANISASIGYACYPRNGQNMIEIMAEADKNMYLDKKNKPGRSR